MSEATSIFDGGDQSWIDGYLKPRHPDLVNDYLEASRLFRSAKAAGSISTTALSALTRHAESPRKPLGENAASMLGELYDIDGKVGESIRKLAAGRALHSRVNALVALGSCRTTLLHEELFATALGDRSARVRTLAADKIVSRGMRQLLAKLTSACLSETNEKVKDELRADIDYLKQGYHLRSDGEDVWVTCRVGGTSTSKWFSKATFEKEGCAWIKGELTRAA
jgi:hypothetical protein